MGIELKTKAQVGIHKAVTITQNLSLENVWFGFLGLMEIFVGIQIWNSSTTVPFANPLSIIIIASGLGITALAPASKTIRHYRVIEITILLIFVISFIMWVYSKIYGNPSYGTDEIAFDQYSAQLALHHIDPYGLSLAPSLDIFQVPIMFHTFTLTGATVDHLSYPAMSFLPYIPLLAMGVHVQSAVYTDAVFWLISMLLMYMMLPRPYKPLALVIGMSFAYMNYVVGGVTDALYIPFLLIAAWKWDRFEEKDAGIAKWIGPVGLGLAACIKQTAWFLIPFMLIAIYKERKSIRSMIRYGLICGISFLVPNVPFILTNWHTWLTGIMIPFRSSTVPSGQGLINLSLVEHMGGGNLTLYSKAGEALLLAMLIGIFLNYPRYKRLIFILPSLVLFFPTRSFATYLIDLFPIMVVSVLTIQTNTHMKTVRDTFLVWVERLAYIPFAFCVIWAISIPSPLRMQITNVHTTGELQSIDQITVTVENRSNKPVTPHFTLTTSPQMTSFWVIKHGPVSLRPGQVATYQLAAPNVPSMPNIQGGFIVDAFSENPASLSTTSIYKPYDIHTFITPQAIDQIVPLHHRITLTVKLFDQVGRRIREAGQRVYLGQVVYDQSGLYAGEASINGNPEGKSPVMAITNANGIATFTIEGIQQQNAPVFFQAFVQPNGQYPFGYSQIISVHFK